MDTQQAPMKRTKMNITVHYRRSYAREEATGSLKNVSLSGAFLAHRESDLQAGDKVILRFVVAGREREIAAAVVWTNLFGAGIKFMPVNNRDVQIIDDLIYFVEAKQTGTKSVLDQIFKKVA